MRIPEIEYRINEENRTVVALCTINPSRFVEKFIQEKYGRTYWTRPTKTEKICAIAKCFPGDEWDVNIGKSIARKRLLRKYYGELRAFVRKERKIIEESFDGLEKEVERR